MNNDLISRNALLEAFEDDIDTDVCQEYADYECLWGFSRDTVESAIQAAPPLMRSFRCGVRIASIT